MLQYAGDRTLHELTSRDIHMRGKNTLDRRHLVIGLYYIFGHDSIWAAIVALAEGECGYILRNLHISVP